MKEKVDHILRPSLPWRESAGLTECGLKANEVQAIDRGQFLDRLQEMGKRRTAILTCMTCADTAGRWGDWESDPREAMSREIRWENKWNRKDHGDQLKDELIAIAALIEKYKEDFRGILLEMESRRLWNEAKAENKAKKLNKIKVKRL